MKTYNAEKRTSSQLKKTIENTLEWHEKYRNSYFWSSLGNAADRRRQEERFEQGNPAYAIQTAKGLIEVEPSLRVSCKNVYYQLEVTLNGMKKDIRTLKDLLK